MLISYQGDHYTVSASIKFIPGQYEQQPALYYVHVHANLQEWRVNWSFSSLEVLLETKLRDSFHNLQHNADKRISTT